MLGAGLNVVPTALVALGAGAVALAIAPRVAATIVYGIIIWSLVVDLSASLVASLRGLEPVTLFHYMALAPAQHPQPAALAITTAAAVALCILATVLFGRRDLQMA
jgi:ABC-2 type transport system permease protein